MSSSPSRAAIAGIRYAPMSSSLHKPGMRVLMATVGADGKRQGLLMEAIVIEWSPSRSYLKALIDPTRTKVMSWFDVDGQDLVCLEVLPDLPRPARHVPMGQGQTSGGTQP